MAASSFTFQVVPGEDQLDVEGSDSENDSSFPEVAWYNFELKFGKYKGELLPSMISTKKKRDYLRWLLKWEEIRTNTKKAIEQALEAYAEAKVLHMPSLSPRKRARTLAKSTSPVAPTSPAAADGAVGPAGSAGVGGALSRRRYRKRLKTESTA